MEGLICFVVQALAHRSYLVIVEARHFREQE